MYLAILGLPILGSIISGFFGRKVGVSGAQIITCTCVIITTFLALLTFIEVGLNKSPVKIHLFRWIDAEYLNVAWAFNFDSLTVSMLIPVLIISSLVHIYSVGYMSHDPHNQRFFSYLSLFTFMMIILVTGDNFLVMFVGWEGVGVCSYLLVSFWFTRIAANQSSLAAFFTNRVGDYILTVGMFAILLSFGNVDYTTVFSLSPFYSETVIFFIGLCLLIGAMAKSSQIGLHVWLPMAMEGPTPVSALIHAATMVTAGVYLLMRASPLIEYSSTVLLLCLWVGAITTVFSSLIGLFQQDIKKVIAYSTMSQLGMMVIAVGLSSYTIALFHLINHAFYKGLLFLCAGAVIHAVADNQDFRKYGGLISYLPLTYSLMLTASLSLVAFPFMTGFYSKDFILESAYGQYKLSSIIVYFIATIGAMFTTLYSVKVLYLTFLTNPNGSLINYKPNKSAHEGDLFMSTPLIILGVFSIFFGYISKDLFIGLGSDFFSDNGLYIHPYHEIMLDTEFAVNTFYKLLPLFFTISLTICSIIFTEFFPQSMINFKLSRFGYNIFNFFNQRFLVEMYYNKYISGTVLQLGGQTTKVLDKGAVELFGPFGLEKQFTNISTKIDSLSTGVVTNYALYIFIGLIAYISITYFNEFSIFIIIHALINIMDANKTKKAKKQKIKKMNSKHMNYESTQAKLDIKRRNSTFTISYSPFSMRVPNKDSITSSSKKYIRCVHNDSSDQNNSYVVEDSPSPASTISLPEPLEREDVKKIIDDTNKSIEKVRDTTDSIAEKYHDISQVYNKKVESTYNSEQKIEFEKIHEAAIVSEKEKAEAAIDANADGDKKAILNATSEILQYREKVLDEKRNHLESNGITLNSEDKASISQFENQRESLKTNLVEDNNHLQGLLSKLDKATNVLEQEDRNALISLGSELYELKLEIVTIVTFY